MSATLAAGAVTLFEFVIPYDRKWQPPWTEVKTDLLFMVAVQMVSQPLLAAGIINGVAHAKGYRNFESDDTSTNLTPIAVLVGGLFRFALLTAIAVSRRR